MQTPTWFERNKAVITTVVLAAIPQLVAVVWWSSSISHDLDTIKDRSATRATEINAKFDEMKRWQAQIDNEGIGFRLRSLEQQNTAVNTRLDRMNDSLGAALTQINVSLNALDKRLELITQKVETLTPSRRTSAEAASRPFVPTRDRSVLFLARPP